MANLILGSASPSRARILHGAGIRFTQSPADIDEDALQDDLAELSVADVALALARAKAEAVAATALTTQADHDTPTLVLGCDSIFSLDGAMHGKPHTAPEARRRWRTQRGRTGTLVTGHWLIDVPNHAAVGTSVSTDVTFVDATDDEVDQYVSSGEPLGVAGAFTLEGRAGPLIKAVCGDPSNVLGLSLPGFRELLNELGYPLSAVQGTAGDG